MQVDAVAAELKFAVVREAPQIQLLVELMSNAMHKELLLKGGMVMCADVGVAVEQWLQTAAAASPEAGS